MPNVPFWNGITSSKLQPSGFQNGPLATPKQHATDCSLGLPLLVLNIAFPIGKKLAPNCSSQASTTDALATPKRPKPNVGFWIGKKSSSKLQLSGLQNGPLPTPKPNVVFWICKKLAPNCSFPKCSKQAPVSARASSCSLCRVSGLLCWLIALDANLPIFALVCPAFLCWRLGFLPSCSCRWLAYLFLFLLLVSCPLFSDALLLRRPGSADIHTDIYIYMSVSCGLELLLELKSFRSNFHVHLRRIDEMCICCWPGLVVWERYAVLLCCR